MVNRPVNYSKKECGSNNMSSNFVEFSCTIQFNSNFVYKKYIIKRTV